MKHEMSSTIYVVHAYEGVYGIYSRLEYALRCARKHGAESVAEMFLDRGRFVDTERVWLACAGCGRYISKWRKYRESNWAIVCGSKCSLAYEKKLEAERVRYEREKREHPEWFVGTSVMREGPPPGGCLAGAEAE